MPSAVRKRQHIIEIEYTMSETITKKVGMASLIMMVSIFLSRVIGLAREIVIAYTAGTGQDVDAYQFAFVIPEILNHILASGFLSITFIPIFAYYLSHNKEDEGWQVFSTIFNVLGVILILFISISWIFTPEILGISGFEDQATRASAIRMTRIILPAQLFFFLGGLLMAVQFVKEKFAIPAVAPLIYNLGIISGGIVLGPWLGMEGFCWGVLGGAFLGNFVIQCWGAKKVGMKFYLSFNIRHPDLKKYILLTLPLMVGLTMTFSTEVFSKLFGSYLPVGSVSGLNYSLRIMFVLVGLFGQAAGVASYPFLARLVAENRFAEMNQLLNKTIRFIALVIPFSALCMVLRREIVVILFQRGSFDIAATEMTSNILMFVLVGATAFAAQTVVGRGYYAMQNTLFPTLFGSLAVLISIPFYFIGMKWMGVTGVALVMSCSAFMQVLLLFILWNRRTQNRGSSQVYQVYLKILLISVPIGFMLEWLRKILTEIIGNSGILGCMAVSIFIAGVFISLFIIAGHIFKVDEISLFTEKVLLKVKKRGK